MTFCNTHRSEYIYIAQLSSEMDTKTVAADPQPDNVQRVRELGLRSPKWDASVQSSPHGSRNHADKDPQRL